MANKYEIFLDILEEEIHYDADRESTLPREYYEVLDEIKILSQDFKEKPLFTEIGLQILEYLQEAKGKNLKAKDIADGMCVSSRQISGAIRKLVTDGFVDKYGKNPVIYSLTEEGLNFNIKEYKEKMTNEEEND